MRDPPEGGCCKCIFSFTITLALTALFLWLSLRPSNPTFSINQFYVFTLNNNTNNNHTIFYDLKLNNNNNDKGIYYDALNLTFYYKFSNFSYYPIGSGNYTGFYQGHGKHTDRVGVVVMRSGVVVKWENDVFETVSKNGVVVFRVEVVTAVRFRIVFWKTKRRRFEVGSDLRVDDHGGLIKRKKNKGIKLSNGVGVIKEWFKLLISLISVVIVVLLW
ncbi:hypothetical protein RND81_09G035400 [Saponaria officinalis]|uniref:Late embryogenesis abundant protein LEA-2 subgroup domain-containing protein n=1 Tax=Saponaria officinalis TaxID=3572 RepID=A0AAW1II78_SAPOF